MIPSRLAACFPVYSGLKYPCLRLIRAGFVGAMGALLCIAPSIAFSAAYDDFIGAVNQGNASEVATWLKRGMDPNTLDPNGQPVLHLAARVGAIGVVQTLAAADINLNRKNSSGETAIMVAALQGHIEVVKFLISREAEVNQPGWTPLIYAATTGRNEIIKILIENHAYIDATSPSGVTSLMMAVRGGHRSTVKLLIDEDADVTVRNDVGDSALTWAERGPDAEMVKMLRMKLMP